MPKLTVGSLFAGIGGLELGLEMTGGFETVWQCENDEYATRVLEKHWPGVRRWGDVTTFPPDAASTRPLSSSHPRGNSEAEGSRARVQQLERCRSDWHVDLICGGFPCQPVSTAGKRGGEDDDRWLWDEMRRVCEVLRPTWVLAENVPGLLSARDVRGVRGGLFGRVAADLASLGYRVRWDCVSAASVGAPHIRDRVFIIGFCRNSNAMRCPGNHGTEQQIQDETANADRVVDDVADAKSTEPQGIGAESGRRQSGLADGGADVADADQQSLGRLAEPWGKCNQWSVEPNVGRVAHGVPSRVDRLRCLGNAVVPPVAQFIGQRILAAEAEK